MGKQVKEEVRNYDELLFEIAGPIDDISFYR